MAQRAGSDGALPPTDVIGLSLNANQNPLRDETRELLTICQPVEAAGRHADMTPEKCR